MKNDKLMASGMPETISEIQAKRARAWKPEQVPIGALIKPYGIDSKDQGIIVAVALSVPSINSPALILEWNTSNKYMGLEYEFLGDLTTSIFKPVHSTDGGKTWKPCYNE